jgi:DNA-binding FadR family transcriptional regulator
MKRLGGRSSVRRPHTRATARNANSDMVRNGDLKPGQTPLGLRELPQRLNISRAPLREDLSILEILGALGIEPGRGAFLTVPKQGEEELRHNDSDAGRSAPGILDFLKRS